MDKISLHFNPVAAIFDRFKPKALASKEEIELKNSQAYSQEQFDFLQYSAKFGTGNINEDIIVTNIDFEMAIRQKRDRISKYREMSLYPEITDAIDYISDEAIISDEAGSIITLNIKEELPANTEKRIREIWDYLVTDVLEFNERAWEWFKRWLTESELYLENVLDNSKKNLIGLKMLPAYTMTPVYDGTRIRCFEQRFDAKTGTVSSKDKIAYDSQQITYINYGLYGENKLDTRGYLEAAIRTYNQLRNLEDALIVYRLVRAPERRVWNIDVGKMPKGKAEEYIKQLIQKYKKRSIYDATTGKVDSAANIQALTEDFWFARRDDGRGTSVETIGGGMQLGELEDVNYFLKKLYKTLKLPRSRWDDNNMGSYSTGRSGEITREEVKFSRFIERLQDRFKYIVLQPFFLLLKMRGIDDKYINKGLYEIKFTESNLFKEFKEMEINEQKFGLLGSASSFVVTPYNKNEPQSFFAKEFIFKKYFKMTDEDYEKNEEMKKKEISEMEEQQQQDQLNQQDQFGGEGGFGNEGGEGDIGNMTPSQLGSYNDEENPEEKSSKKEVEEEGKNKDEDKLKKKKKKKVKEDKEELLNDRIKNYLRKVV